MDTNIDATAEEYVRQLSAELVKPEGGECLACFVDRMLTEFGCDGDLRFARAYRDARAPQATALERRLGAAGGFCDCEVFANALEPAAHLWTRGRWEEDEEGYAEYASPAPPERMPPCGGARRGSTRACSNWQRQYRPRW